MSSDQDTNTQDSLCLSLSPSSQNKTALLSLSQDDGQPTTPAEEAYWKEHMTKAPDQADFSDCDLAEENEHLIARIGELERIIVKLNSVISSHNVSNSGTGKGCNKLVIDAGTKDIIAAKRNSSSQANSNSSSSNSSSSNSSSSNSSSSTSRSNNIW